MWFTLPSIIQEGDTKKMPYDEILNHFIPKSSSGKVEGYNVVVKLLKRINFSIRDTELYAKKIMLGAFP